ncbi:MAG: LysM peptidoglycan-binding domain-containing protein [bacterium]|nr:LysM peptidoglycan-binding domain-containing protein [bacterium]MDI1334977.1 LysM peptidoglycan-binding domain-containing protein [Lacunisphaera sp.]
MKILQIFGAVVAVHLLAFIFIFASPGCQSGPRNIPTPDATVVSGSSAAPVNYAPNLVIPQPVDLAAAPGPATTYLPVNESGHAAPTRPGSPAAAAVTPAKPTADVASVTTYTVGKGDSLWSIANKNHLTVAELAKFNNLGVGTALQPGRKLMIPGGKVPVAPKETVAAPAASKSEAAAPAHGTGEAVKHTVQPGESLGIIARKYQVTTGELAAANSITDPSKVRAGQQLIIPGFKAVGGTKPATGATAPAKGAAPGKPATPATTPAASTPHFEITAPPPGQDLDSGLKGAGTEVPTIKVEDAQPPKK